MKKESNVLNKRSTPSGELLRSKCEKPDRLGHQKIYFEARILQCRNCELKEGCLKIQLQQTIPKAMEGKYPLSWRRPSPQSHRLDEAPSRQSERKRDI